MQEVKNNIKKVFYHSAIEWKDEVEEKFERARVNLGRVGGNASERETHDVLTTAACRDKNTHDDICLGLLGTILTEPQMAPKCYRDLNFLSRDNLNVVIEQLIILAADKYQKLTDVSRGQMVWITRELVRAGINSVDILCWNLMRQIAGGDLSNRNLWLAESMLDIYGENRPWLDKYPVLIASVIYTYLRVLEDHTAPSLSSLKQKEVNFLVSLIRDHFTDVCINQNIGLGRDFLRLLQSVSRIPEMEAIWNDIYMNPKSLSPHLTGVHQILNSRTSRKYLQSRLTPDMEKKIHFLTSQVRFGMQKRYQDWFQRQYLSTPESHTLRADIIRFIVGVIHPTNEILCSDILPRWAVIGWLLATCTNSVATANAKLALFYDWLVFDPLKDNIMNIEPGILVMYHSLRPHPAITATLLDFLIRLTGEYWPSGVDKIKDGIGAALRTIVDKKVMSSLDVLLENPKLDSDLRSAIQENLIVLLDRRDKNQTVGGKLTMGNLSQYSETNNHNVNLSYSSTIDKDSPPSLELHHSPSSAFASVLSPPSNPVVTNLFGSSSSGGNTTNTNTNNNSDESNNSINTSVINNLKMTLNQTVDSNIIAKSEDNNNGDVDELEEDSKDHITLLSNNNNNHNTTNSISKASTSPPSTLRNSPNLGSLGGNTEEAERSKIFEIVYTLPPSLRIPFESMLKSESVSDKSDVLDDILEDLADRAVENSERQSVSKCMLHIFKSDLSKPCIQKDSLHINDNLEITPISEILNDVLELKPNDKTYKRKNFMRLLADLIGLMPQIGYKILLVLEQISRTTQPSKNMDHYPLLYKNLCQNRSLKLEAAVTQDLKCCWEYEPNLVGFLCPILYSWYETDTVGSVDILRTIVSALDPYQLQENMWKIVQGEFIIADENNLIPILTKTLEWETWEQHCVWTMILAHSFTVEDYLPLIPMLDHKTNAEALTSLLLLLKAEKPTCDILGPLLCRKPSAKDGFVISLLLSWSDKEEDEELLAENMATVLVRASGSPVKRKRGVTGARGTASPAGPATPTIENVLAHLELLRLGLKARDAEDPGIFNKDAMQAALLQVQSWVTETQKNKYKDLLQLAAAEEQDSKEISPKSTRRATSARSSKLPSSPTPTSNYSSRTRSGRLRPPVKDASSSEESDSDDEIPRSRTTKRRKKAVYMSDSD